MSKVTSSRPNESAKNHGTSALESKNTAPSLKKDSRFSHYQHPSKAFVLALIGLFALIGLVTFYASHAATSPISSLEAEAMSLPSGTTIISDTAASGTQAIKFSGNGVASSSVNLANNADSLVVRARGDQCKGAPAMVIKLDNVQVGTATNVSSTAWADYNFTKALTAGSHTVTVSFTNYSMWKNCRKSLYLDKMTFNGTVVAAPQCSNSLDDDADGKVDYPADPGCAATSDTTEADPVGTNDLMSRKDLLYGSEIGAWVQDGKPAVDLATNIPNLVKAAKFPLIRFAMYDCFEGMICGRDNHAGTQKLTNFNAAIDGIRNNLNAEPFFKLVPIANGQSPIGYPVAIDGSLFCPPKDNLAMNLPVYKGVVDRAGDRIHLYESTNEGEISCYKYWGYSGIGATGVSTLLGNHFAQNMPQLKKYARSKSIDIKTIGYVGYPQGASGWGNACTNPSIKAVIEFNDAAYQAYINSGNDPDYIPDAESIHAYPHSGDFRNSQGVYDSDNCIFQYYKLYNQKWRQYLVSKWGPTIGNQIKLSISEWQAGTNDWIAAQSVSRMQQYYTDWYKYVLQGQALPDGSVGATERWWNANLFIIASDNNYYDWIKGDGTGAPWYETIKNISISDPNR